MTTALYKTTASHPQVVRLHVLQNILKVRTQYRPYTQHAAHITRASPVSHFGCQKCTQKDGTRVYTPTHLLGVHSFCACFDTQNVTQKTCMCAACCACSRVYIIGYIITIILVALIWESMFQCLPVLIIFQPRELGKRPND